MTRGDFRHFLAIGTRWMDNDVYGHVNNVVYYAYFDTVVNEHLVRHAALDPATSDPIGVVVETSCTFRASVAFPDALEAGLRVSKLGRTSVTYEIGIFKAGEDAPAAEGRFVHVYVDRKTRRPVPIPDPIRAALAPLQGT